MYCLMVEMWIVLGMSHKDLGLKIAQQTQDPGETVLSFLKICGEKVQNFCRPPSFFATDRSMKSNADHAMEAFLGPSRQGPSRPKFRIITVSGQKESVAFPGTVIPIHHNSELSDAPAVSRFGRGQCVADIVPALFRREDKPRQLSSASSKGRQNTAYIRSARALPRRLRRRQRA